MLYTIFIPFLIGGLGVLQNTLNKKIAGGIGLPLAIAINSAVLCVCSAVLWFSLKAVPQSQLPELYQTKTAFDQIGWKNWLPGLMGFFIIVTAPYSIQKAGATKVFVIIILAQIIVSLLWDRFIEQMSLDPLRIVGAILAFVGALLAAR